MGLVDQEGKVDHYDGWLRVMDADGRLLADRIDPRGYQRLPGRSGRAVVVPEVHVLEGARLSRWHLPGRAAGARDRGRQLGTPQADAELREFRARLGRIPESSFHYHYARLIDTLYAAERIGELLNDPEILSPRVRSFAGINATRGSASRKRREGR